MEIINRIISNHLCLEVARKILHCNHPDYCIVTSEIATIFDNAKETAKNEEDKALLVYFYALWMQALMQPEKGLDEIENYKKSGSQDNTVNFEPLINQLTQLI